MRLNTFYWRTSFRVLNNSVNWRLQNFATQAIHRVKRNKKIDGLQHTVRTNKTRLLWCLFTLDQRKLWNGSSWLTYVKNEKNMKQKFATTICKHVCVNEKQTSTILSLLAAFVRLFAVTHGKHDSILCLEHFFESYGYTTGNGKRNCCAVNLAIYSFWVSGAKN